jgi:hypothetical protein
LKSGGTGKPRCSGSGLKKSMEGFFNILLVPLVPLVPHAPRGEDTR